MTRRALEHPLHLIAIIAALVGFAVAYWMGQGDNLLLPAMGLAFLSAVDLARRLGLEPANDPSAPHNRGKV
jgi:hypothetical protein